MTLLDLSPPRSELYTNFFTDTNLRWLSVSLRTGSFPIAGSPLTPLQLSKQCPRRIESMQPYNALAPERLDNCRKPAYPLLSCDQVARNRSPQKHRRYPLPTQDTAYLTLSHALRMISGLPSNCQRAALDLAGQPAVSKLCLRQM